MQRTHRHGISRAAPGAASTVLLLLLAGCEDIVAPGSTVSTADLVILAQQPGTPEPGARTFWVSNSSLTVRTLDHPDAFNTVYAELRFPAGSLTSLGGQPLGPTDSVQVTVQPRPGDYGITLSPAGLAFSSSIRPTLRFLYARYGDPGVADGVPRYPSPAAYEQALEVWREVSVGQWSTAPGSTRGTDQVQGGLVGGGMYVVAARR